jgi:phage tail sheath protein FI
LNEILLILSKHLLMAKVSATSGVYIEEKNAFANSVVPVATAVPAFVGYTEQPLRDGQNLTMKPTRLSSFGEYVQYFGGAPKTTCKIENTRFTDPAFSVDIGLGSTMTPDDNLEGIMRILVKIAVTRPGEFIVLTLQQKMPQS